jgi:hypothetical protein
LNKGQKPPIIADRIEVKELNMGTIVSFYLFLPKPHEREKLTSLFKAA